MTSEDSRILLDLAEFVEAAGTYKTMVCVQVVPKDTAPEGPEVHRIFPDEFSEAIHGITGKAMAYDGLLRVLRDLGCERGEE